MKKGKETKVREAERNNKPKTRLEQHAERILSNWEPKPCHKCEQNVPGTNSKRVVLWLMGQTSFAPLGVDRNWDQHVSATADCEGSPSMQADISGERKTRLHNKIVTVWNILKSL